MVRHAAWGSIFDETLFVVGLRVYFLIYGGGINGGGFI